MLMNLSAKRVFVASVCLLTAMASVPVQAQTEYDPLRFEKQVVVAACEDPMQMEVLPGGDVLFIERAGRVRLAMANSGTIRELGPVPVSVQGEVGLLGLACDRAFEQTGWLYLFFCPKEEPGTLRLSRFTVSGSALDMASEVRMLSYKIDAAGANHMGGGLYMDGRGNLHLGTGDNCPPIPELPVDRRPGRRNFDAFRSSANTQDLRGKVLRIHPEPDGRYTIPEGNLFGPGGGGRPEIYAMGCRNAFRVTVDERDGCVYWGDVGPNIQLDLNLGPNGYDEFNRAPTAGNFGWPMCVGLNEPYRLFDFDKRAGEAPFDLTRPVNDSPNNTGARVLPPPLPAFIWYPSGPSDRFPTLGSGGRSAMAGPVYRRNPDSNAPLRLPDELDGAFFIYEWTRNWIQTVRQDNAGNILAIEPFLPDMVFRKPIDMEVGPDGTLYVIEYGDRWFGNTDARIVRLVYQRGNRAPVAAIEANPPAGKHPLTVRLDAGRSSDKDAGDVLSYAWELDGRPLADAAASTAMVSFNTPGDHQITVRVHDRAGVMAEASTSVRVGNARPLVNLSAPTHGSFFDPGETIRYEIEVHDEEDGSTAAGTIAPAKVRLTPRFLSRRPDQDARNDSGTKPIAGSTQHPGLDLMRKTTCFSCHHPQARSAGPPYREVARKYAADASARERLAARIISGGAGVWGNVPMPPHPQHDPAQTRLMVDWILSQATDDAQAPIPGTRGYLRAGGPNAPASGVLMLSAEYTDAGAQGIPPLGGESSIVLHTRRKPAAFFDNHQGAELVDVFERGAGLVARFAPGDWIAFRDINLAGIDRVLWHAAALPGNTGRLSLRIDSPNGPELTHIELEPAADALGELYRDHPTPIQDPGGLHDLYIVADKETDANRNARNTLTKPPTFKTFSLAWLEFQDSPQSVTRKRAEQAARTRVLLIPTKLDHPWATHMYTDVCRILAACLNQSPGVEAVVSPELDWPKDERILDDVDAIVYYSRPSGDIFLAPEHKAQAEALMKRGVGFVAIHWSTGVEKELSTPFLDLLGGWFNFDHASVKIDTQPLKMLAADHPICHGWDPYPLHDEFYLNLKFHPAARPILSVNVDGVDQTVAWVLDRPDGGRSFGSTLGHFHENFALPAFRRMLVNGILWSARAEVPLAGAPVDVDHQLLELPPQARPVVRAWTYNMLRPLVDAPGRARSFARGEQLFRLASCASCHKMGESGSPLGPNLTEIRQRLAAQPDPRGALLREIVEPSASIHKDFQSQLLSLRDGQVISGLVIAENDGILQVVTSAAEAEKPRAIRRDQIDEQAPAAVSLMPTGLLDTLNADEILDLLAYVEAGGDSRYVLFEPPPTLLEPWADGELPVKGGLEWWLDSTRINPARSAQGLAPLGSGSLVGVWPDASGHRRHPRQRRPEAQPLFEEQDGYAFVRFDGVDDLLSTTSDAGFSTRDFTAVVAVRPDDNRNWPGLVSGNLFDRNDYQTGFNIDMMPDTKDSFCTLMAEGPGFIGVRNLMTESVPFGRWVILTVSSRPGPAGVQLWINGRPQGTLPRDDGRIQADEMTVAARYWSNDADRPAFNRGHFHGSVAQVLLYNRVLSDDERMAVEQFVRSRAFEATAEPESAGQSNAKKP